MKEFTYTVTDPVGIHARPAGRLAKKIEELGASVTIIKDGKSVDTRRIIALMQLGIKCGDTISFRVEGVNEDKNAQLLLAFLKENNY